MKSHERLKAEGRIERMILDHLRYEWWGTNEGDILRSEGGDFLIEVKAHYLGSKSKRLTEPADDVVD